MAYQQSELDALNNSLLASAQPDKISAAKHRQYNRAVNYELYDAQSRANLLAQISTSLSLNPGDKLMVFTNGVARQVDISNFSTSGSTQRKYLGRFTTEALLKASYPDNFVDRTAGDYAQVAETNTYWERDPESDLAWFDTGDIIENPDLDTYPTLGNFDRPSSSGGNRELIDTKADTIHTHSAAEAWLAAILDGLVSNSELREEVFALLEQGPGMLIAINEVTGKIRFTNTGSGEGSLNWGGIGGDIEDQADLKAIYLKKYVWKTSSLVGTTRTFDFDNVPNPAFEISPTADETWVFTNVPTDLTTAIQLQIVVNYAGITEFTAGLPALSGGAVHKESGTSNIITDMPLPTGKVSGYVSDVFAYRKSDGGYNWIFGEDGGSGGGATELDDLTDVNASSPADNDVLTWDAATSKWIPAAPTGGGGGDVVAPDWTTATPSAGNLTLDFDDSPTPYIGYVESGAVTWLTPTNVLADPKAVLATIQVQLASTSHAITLPANFYVKNTAKTSLTLTGVSGDIITLNVLKRATKYEIFYASDAVELAKAVVADINTGTDDAKYLTSLGLEGSKYLSQYLNKIYAVATGSANTYVVTLTPAVTAYPRVLAVQINVANTGASTINPNGLGAKSITKNGTTALSSGDLPANQIFLLVYDGTRYQVAGSIGPGGGSFTAATQTEAETASDATLANRNNAVGFTARSFRWAWDKMLTVANTITGVITMSSLTASLPLKLNASKQIISALIATTDVVAYGAKKIWANLSSISAQPIEVDVLDASEMIFKRVTTATNYTCDGTEHVVGVTSTAATRTITLALATSYTPGQINFIVDESNGAVTNNINASFSGSDTSQGTTSISTNGGKLAFYSDGVSKFYFI
jgi:hypothetical protein